VCFGERFSRGENVDEQSTETVPPPKDPPPELGEDENFEDCVTGISF